MTPLPRLLPAALCADWLRRTDGSASSLPLTQLPLAADEVLRAVAASAAAPLLTAALGPSPWCNLAQSWLRHDFLAHAGQPAPAAAALAVWTLWIALTPCGTQAPSLQWVDAQAAGLLSPDELQHEAVVQRYGAAALHHAVLQPGDALLFGGLCVHRTHLTAEMAQPRVSLELRFFRADALPARVAGDAGQRLT